MATWVNYENGSPEVINDKVLKREQKFYSNGVLKSDSRKLESISAKRNFNDGALELIVEGSSMIEYDKYGNILLSMKYKHLNRLERLFSKGPPSRIYSYIIYKSGNHARIVGKLMPNSYEYTSFFGEFPTLVELETKHQKMRMQ